MLLKIKNILLYNFFVFIILNFLISCGGSGGDSNNNQTHLNLNEDLMSISVDAGTDRFGSITEDINNPKTNNIIFITGNSGLECLWSWSIIDSPINCEYRLTSPNSRTCGFYANKQGKYTIQLKVTDTNKKSGVDTLIVELIHDIDFDGIDDSIDPDRDGDGFINENDIFPNDKVSHLDYDSNGIGNYYVDDVDSDGINDVNDAYPLNPLKYDAEIFNETKEIFNSNQNDGISVAEIAGSTPIQINGTIFSENNKPDIDYYAVNFNNSGRYTIYVNSPYDISLSLAILNNTGSPIQYVYSDLISNKGNSAVSTLISEPTELFVSIIEASGFSHITWTYSISIFQDEDFDCIDDNLEKAIDSNHLNIDSDGDGISDYEEILTAKKDWNKNKDTDLDNIPLWWDIDSDNDGLLDSIEYYKTEESNLLQSNDINDINDADCDNIPNYIDEDSDGNGILDKVEAEIKFNKPKDTDLDRIPDFLDLDDDSDGLLDINELEFRLIPLKSSDIFIQQLTNTTLKISNVFNPGDNARIEITNQNDISYPIIIIQTDNTILNIIPEIDESGINFIWPEGILNGVVKVLVAFNNLKTNSLDILSADKKSPILKDYSLNHEDNSITFFGYNLDTNLNVNFHNTSVYVENSGLDSTQFKCYVPENTKTGYVYLNTSAGISNMLWLRLLKKISGQIILPKNSDIDIQSLDISWSLTSDEINADKDGFFKINVDASQPAIVYAFIKDTSYESTVYSLFLQSLVFKESDNIILNTKNSAIAMVWSKIDISYLVNESSYNDLYNELSQLDEILNLAELIEVKLAENPFIFSNNDDEIKKISKQAYEKASELLKSYNNFNKRNKNFLKGKFGEDAIVTPSSADDIDVFERDDTGNINITNDTQLYLSAKITSSDGKVLKDHITGLNNMMSPQGYGLLLWASTTSFNYPNGENCIVEVITAGFDKQFEPFEIDSKYNNVYRWLVIRTAIERILWPVVSNILGSINADELTKIIFANTPNIIAITEDFINGNVKNGVNGLLNAFWQDIASIPPGHITQQLAKKLGKDFAQKALAKIAAKIGAKFIPGVGQIELAINIVGYINDGVNIGLAISDMGTIDRVIRFNVKFPLQIEEINPAKIIANNKNKNFIIKGSGFSPISRWGLFSDTILYPKITLTDNFGNDVTVEAYNIIYNGTKMQVTIPGAFFHENLQGTIKISVHHPSDENTAITERDPAITVISGIEISSVEPNYGVGGTRAKIYGAGFSPITLDNEIKIGDKSVIISKATELSLSIVIPNEIDAGQYGLKVRSRLHEGWSKWSNELDFRIIQGKTKLILCDNGNRKDDAYALYVDGKLKGSLYSSTSTFCKTFNLNLENGDHFVMLLGLEAPDSIGTYTIDFVDIDNITGDPLFGRDLVPGVKKCYYFSITDHFEYNSDQKIIPFKYVPEFKELDF